MTEAPLERQQPAPAPAPEERTARLREVPAPAARPLSLVERHPAAASVVAAVVSRLLVFAVAFSSSYYLGERLRHGPPAQGLSGDVLFDRFGLSYLLSMWRQWDAVWFQRIAEHGYGPQATAFFPLYPLLVRSATAVAAHRTILAGVVISVICFAAALLVLYRLVRDDFDAPTAAWAVLLTSTASMSFYFQAVYSESLFLLLTLACFTAARRGRWALAGLAGGLAALTRSAGVLLLVPLVWMWFEQFRGAGLRLPGARPAPPLVARGRQRLGSLAALLLVPAGLGAYMGYLYLRFGDPLEFLTAEKQWHRHFHLPFVSVWEGAKAAWRSVATIAADPSVFTRLDRLPFRDHWVVLGNLTAFLAFVLAVLLLAVCWRRLPSSYTVFAAVTLLLPLAYPTHGTPLLSFPRFLLVDFPVFVALATLVVRRPVLRWALIVASVAGLVVFTTIYANGMWVA